jgi:hypothetical protein
MGSLAHTCWQPPSPAHTMPHAAYGCRLGLTWCDGMPAHAACICRQLSTAAGSSRQLPTASGRCRQHGSGQVKSCEKCIFYAVSCIQELVVPRLSSLPWNSPSVLLRNARGASKQCIFRLGSSPGGGLVGRMHFLCCFVHPRALCPSVSL